MNRTGRFGHGSAAAHGPDMSGQSASVAAISANSAHLAVTRVVIVSSARRPAIHLRWPFSATLERAPRQQSPSSGSGNGQFSPENALFAAEFSVLDSYSETPMPPILLSPLLKWSLAALGGAMVVHWVAKEARRINEELDQAKRAKVRISDQENRPTLRRDPTTGEYRL
jgi:regulator of protease activity HflC (stomatin/prohibitin superfamily)